jgi:hypothetical protein
MVDTRLFGPLFTRVAPVASMFRILVDLGAADPAPVITGVGADVVLTNFRILDFEVWNNGAAQAGATAQIFTNLNGGGNNAVTDVVTIALQNEVKNCITLAPAQTDLTFGNAVEDVMTIDKHAAGDRGLASILCYLL